MKRIFLVLLLAIGIFGVINSIESNVGTPISRDVIFNLTTTAELGRTNTVNTDARGIAYLQVNAETGEISGYVLVSGFKPMSAHIHRGAMGTTGDVKITLIKSMTDPNRFDIPINSKLESTDDLRAGLYYINVHSDENPDGEVRGQITLNIGYGY